MQTVLFRFHSGYDICLQNLMQLRRLNGDIAIYGLYGGQDKISQMPRALKEQFHTISQPFDDPFYCWKNADLTVRKWYQQVGHKISFKHLYLQEWDLLLFDSLKNVFGKLKANANYTSIHSTYKQARRTKWDWVTDNKQSQLCKIKTEIAQQVRTVNNNVSFGVMPGAIFCRNFLDQFSTVYPSSYLNDEVRLSYWSQAFKVPLLDNGLWTDTHNLIDCDGKSLSIKSITNAVLNGAKAVHSVRSLLPDNILAK